MNKRKFTYLSALAFLLAAVYLIWSTRPLRADMSAAPTESAGSSAIFLPILSRTAPFEPGTDTTLPAGTYTFSSFDIAGDVSVSVTGDVHITVLGDTNIVGTLTGDCVEIQLHGRQQLVVTGTVDNECSDPQQLVEGDSTGDLTIYGYSESMTVGVPGTPALLRTSGHLNMGNAPDIEDWEFDLLPEERATAPTLPVCSAQADTLLGTVDGGSYVDVVFFGKGIDPNGGPVSYEWAFGDGTTSAEKDPLHSYDSWGVYDVTLTVANSSDMTCQATLRLVLDDGEENIPDSPAVWLTVVDLAVAVGEPAEFAAATDHLDDDELIFAWDFGDPAEGGRTANDEPDPSHIYQQPGRYQVAVTVTDAQGHTATAGGSLFVHEALEPAFGPLDANCLAPGPGVNMVNVTVDYDQAAAGKNGKHERLRYRGNVYLGPDTDIKGQDGGDGEADVGASVRRGGHGGRGGSLSVYVRGSLTLCGGAVVAAGNGGQGGLAISDTPAPGHAKAYGGKGGAAADLLRLSATQSIRYVSIAGDPVIRRPGNGGEGGTAIANGGDGNDNCDTGLIGARASAYGGTGGKSSKERITRGLVIGLGNSLVEGGLGGDGGRAEANAGAGGNATCPTFAQGGQGAQAYAVGGRGGQATYRNNPSAPVAADAFKAGKGGDSEANGGNGGNTVANPPGGVTAIGGPAGKANARGGNGAKGRINGEGGDSLAVGGRGGHATSFGEAGPPCGDGGDATATGGWGGNANAKKGKGYRDAPDGTAIADAGDGGTANAIGGSGGDCPICPDGDGGDGGPATATGGRGGDATGNGTRNGGDGGNASATGGEGGKGAECCGPPDEPGGDGGMGGDATSTAGLGGTPGGTQGSNGGNGGNGGDGGDGDGPGSGGAGGSGNGSPNDVPDGLPGLAGEPCPDPPAPILPGRPDHGSIPPGEVPPGSNYGLEVLDEDNLPFGIVQTHFMSPDELLPYGIPDAFYQKSPGQLFVGMGGIQYDLLSLPDDFSVIEVEFNIFAECPAGCVVLMGFYQGELVFAVQNEGLPEPETLFLPDPADIGSSAPYYDRLIILGHGPFLFDDLGVILWGGEMTGNRPE